MFKSSLCFLPIDGWDKFAHPYTKKEFGKWELLLPPKPDKSPAVDHNTKLKVGNKNVFIPVLTPSEGVMSPR